MGVSAKDQGGLKGNATEKSSSDELFCNILSTTFSYYLSIISTKAGTPCFHSVPAFFVLTGSVYLLHQSAYSILTPHRFVRLLFGKTTQNWCSCGLVPQMLLEIRFKFHHIRALFLRFTAQSASSWGCHRRAVISLYPNCIVWRMNWRKRRMAYLAYALFYSSGSFHCAN